MHFHPVTLLPFALDGEIAGLQLRLHRLAVHLHGIVQTLSIRVTVQVARHHLAAHPAGDTDFQGKRAGLVLLHRDGHVTRPRIACLLFQHHVLLPHLQVRLVGHEQIDIHVFVLHRIHIARQRGDETADVRRAAGATEPRLSLVLPPALQRIGIEEAAAVQRDAGNQAVI